MLYSIILRITKVPGYFVRVAFASMIIYNVICENGTSAYGNGGAIYCAESSPTIFSNVSPEIQHVMVEGYVAKARLLLLILPAMSFLVIWRPLMAGGACYYSFPTITNNVIIIGE